jgi:hypothetical protein
MPLDLARLAAGVAHLSISYADETLELDYRPERVTGRTFGVLAAARRTGAVDLEALYAELGRIVVRWDLTDEGVPVPTDAAALERLGLALVGTILHAILEDAAQNPTRAEATRPTGTVATSNGSSPTAPSALLVPIGTTSSSAPSGPVSTPPTSPASATPGPPFAGVPG